MGTTDGDNPDLAARVATIRSNFVAGLPGRIEQLERSWRAVREHADAEACRSLMQTAHTLAGSGTTFGFAEISALAQVINGVVRGVLEHNEPLTSDRVAEIEAALAGLRRQVDALSM